MLRKIAIAPIIVALSMMTMVTVMPHHHHQAMVCFVKEICCLDGCCDDEHTQHHDANQEEDESHCVAHEQYMPSERLHINEYVILINNSAGISNSVHIASIPEPMVSTSIADSLEARSVPLRDAPVLSSAGANAPPFLA